MSISNADISAQWELGDPIVVTMESDDGDGDGTDGTDGDSTDGGGDSDGTDGGDSDGTDG
jgi:hypothetical protein